MSASMLLGSAVNTYAQQNSSAGVGTSPIELEEAAAGIARNTAETRAAEKAKHHIPDYSGQKRRGKASFYARYFAGRKMADGARMDPQGSNAASKTLPLGTTAKVTNVETGKSAIVRIEDRGPYVPGRIVDLSPGTAREIGISGRQGVAQVEVTPITVPQPDGSVRLGAGGREMKRQSEILLASNAGPGFARGNPSSSQGVIEAFAAHR